MFVIRINDANSQKNYLGWLYMFNHEGRATPTTEEMWWRNSMCPVDTRLSTSALAKLENVERRSFWTLMYETSHDLDGMTKF